MEYSYRITKYHEYSIDGFLSSINWTSYYDIGSGVSMKDYVIMENEYIRIVKYICNIFNISLLKIKELEIYDREIMCGSEIEIKDLSKVIKNILREKMWCKLSCEKCEFHFGYDFYMYCLSKKDIFSQINKFSNLLNVERFRSPY